MTDSTLALAAHPVDVSDPEALARLCPATPLTREALDALVRALAPAQDSVCFYAMR